MFVLYVFVELPYCPKRPFYGFRGHSILQERRKELPRKELECGSAVFGGLVRAIGSENFIVRHRLGSESGTWHSTSMLLRTLVDNNAYHWLYRTVFLLACAKPCLWGLCPLLLGFLNLVIVVAAFSRSISPTLPARVATCYVQESIVIAAVVAAVKLTMALVAFVSQ